MRAQTGRADLLRALSLGCTGPLPLMHDDHHVWGFVPREVPREEQHVLELEAPIGAKGSQPPAPAALPFRNPLRMPEIWLANTGLERTEQEEAEEEDEPGSARPMDSAELVPPDIPMVGYQDLVPLPRLLPALESAFSRQRHRGLDLPALVHSAARRQWPRSMPMRAVSRWCAELVVALDFSKALFPYRHDMQRLAALLARHFPKTALRIWVGENGPNGGWRPYPAPGNRRLPHPVVFPWPQKGEALLLASDLGLLAERSGANPWQRWLIQAAERGLKPVLMAPLSPDDLITDRLPTAEVLRWSPDSRLRPEAIRPGAEPPAMTQQLDRLLACVAGLRRVDPPLLRALRSCTGRASQDASLEGRVWAHPHVEANQYAAIRRVHTQQHRAALIQNPVEIKQAIRELARVHHAHWPRALAVAEALRWIACSPDHPQVGGALRDIRQFLARLSSAATQQGSEAAQQAAAYLLRSADDACHALAGDLLGQLSSSLNRSEGEAVPWALMQRGDGLYLVPSEKAGPPGVVLADEVGSAAPTQTALWWDGERSVELRLPHLGGAALRLPEPSASARLMLGGQETELRRKRRPTGISSWLQGPQGPKELIVLPTGNVVEVDANHAEFRELVQPIDFPWFELVGDASAFRLEVRVLTLHLPGETIGFRYIPPGTFLMGSPGGVGDSDEHPQHPVTITQGFWLAETPCTQALWQAVMGNNPSHFLHGDEAPRRPVENVSHKDVQAFLKKLQALLPPGVQAVLPTEAEWEYACRADTRTAYWWGDQPDNSKANWGGQNKGTTPVDRYPPNPWGLYDMHGNVWEWCADHPRDYVAKLAVDPRGSRGRSAKQGKWSPVLSLEKIIGVRGKSIAAVRGGSWLDYTFSARAACRFSLQTDLRSQSLGFRFALRPSSSGAEGGE